MTLSNLMSNDPLFIALFVCGTALCVVFSILWTLDLLGWLFRLIFRRHRVVSQPKPLPPPLVNISETFDRLDEIVDDLAGRFRG